MKAQLAHALNSSNLQQKEQHTAIDLVGGMAMGTIKYKLCSDIIHFKDALQAKAFNNLIYGLQREVSKVIKCDRQKLLRVCKQVIMEDVFSFCAECTGTGETFLDRYYVCTKCKGTGLRNYSDAERARDCVINYDEYIKYWADRHKTVQSIYTSNERNGMQEIKRKMEVV
jgi:hypothetical protein